MTRSRPVFTLLRPVAGGHLPAVRERHEPHFEKGPRETGPPPPVRGGRPTHGAWRLRARTSEIERGERGEREGREGD